MTLEIGAAARNITNDPGRPVQGATTLSIAESVRDPLEANVVALRSGDVACVLVSLDLAALEADITDAARQRAADAIGVTAADIVITCTHTHTGPAVIGTNRRIGRDEPYLQTLIGWIVETVEAAWQNLKPAQLRIGAGHLTLGYNRRCCFADGAHEMGAKGHDDFTGIEGPQDDSHSAWLAQTPDGEPIAVVHTNSAHPVNFYGQPFYSADYPGEARRLIRQTLGNVPVLYLNGPFGDINPFPHGKPHLKGERNVRAMGPRVAGETLRLIGCAEPTDDLKVAHTHTTLHIPRRFPPADEMQKAAAAIKQFDAGDESISNWDLLWAHGRVMLSERFANPSDELVELHALRLGDWALFTHPCELYCQFGIDLRRRSPARFTAIADATNGYSGYCPTYGALLGGGYSGDPIYWTRLAPEAGYRMIDEAAAMLHRMWRT